MRPWAGSAARREPDHRFSSSLSDRRCPVSRNPAFRSIIVPVDGSRLAEDAIPYALALAERAHSKVRFVLVHSDQFPPLLIEPPTVYLKGLTQRFGERLGRSLSSIILKGPVAKCLVRHAREIGADLVVMTSH